MLLKLIIFSKLGHYQRKFNRKYVYTIWQEGTYIVGNVHTCTKLIKYNLRCDVTQNYNDKENRKCVINIIIILVYGTWQRETKWSSACDVILFFIKEVYVQYMWVDNYESGVSPNNKAKIGMWKYIKKKTQK